MKWKKVRHLKKWSNWYTLSEKNINEKIPDRRPGVYIIRFPKRIGRLIHSDNDGILLIGEAKNLRNRVNLFHNSINFSDAKLKRVDNYPHVEGGRFNKLDLNAEFNINRIRFRFMPTKNKKEAYEREQKFLKSYQFEFGEIPPLNNKGGF